MEYLTAQAKAEEQDFRVAPDIVYWVDPMTAAPVRFNGAFNSNPVRFNAFFGTPVRFNGDLTGDPVRFNQMSTAHPYAAPEAPYNKELDCYKGKPTVGVVDTGYETKPTNDSGAWKLPGAKAENSELWEVPDPGPNPDNLLDPAAGHNGFIQKLISRGAPKAKIYGVGVIGNFGNGADTSIGDALFKLFDQWRKDGVEFKKSFLNLSFSGYFPNDTPPPAVTAPTNRFIHAGTVVVASAGNDSGCRKTFPAAMPGVVSVGSVGACGPSWFSNHGSWVDVSAPCEDVISKFFNWDGGLIPVEDDEPTDPDKFDGWAMWRGTSFSAPRVVAAMARQVQLLDCTAMEAKKIIIDQPGLFRLPDYGVIVNQGF